VAAVKPVLQALLLADKIYSDAATGKKVIAGTFSKLVIINQQAKVEHGVPSTVTVPAGGMRAGSPFAYISLTDIHHQAKLILRYVKLADTEQQVYFQAELAAQCDDPLRTVELVVPLPMLPPIKGVFALEVLFESELLGSHRVVVEEQEMTGEVS
jgi:hypothetical protein